MPRRATKVRRTTVSHGGRKPARLNVVKVLGVAIRHKNMDLALRAFGVRTGGMKRLHRPQTWTLKPPK